MDAINAKPVIGQTSVEVLALVDILVKVKTGELIEYPAITKAIGRDVRHDRHILASARRIAMRDHNMVFAAVPSSGLKRLDDIETVEICSEMRRKKIRNQARNGIRELSTVNYGVLTQEVKTKHNVGMAMLGALHNGTSKRTMRQIENKVRNDELPDQSGILKIVGWVKDS